MAISPASIGMNVSRPMIGVGALFILSELIFIVVDMQPTGVEMNISQEIRVGWEKFVCVCK